MSLPYRATVAYDHEAADETEMSIYVGDQVIVSSVNDSGWALVDKGDASGWVPVDYLTRDEDGDDVEIPPPAEVEVVEVNVEDLPPPIAEEDALPPPVGTVYDDDDDLPPPPGPGAMSSHSATAPASEAELSSALNKLNMAVSVSKGSDFIVPSSLAPVSAAAPVNNHNHHNHNSYAAPASNYAPPPASNNYTPAPAPAPAPAPVSSAPPSAPQVPAAPFGGDASAVCGGCGALFVEGDASLLAKGKHFHESCFKCVTCHTSLAGVGFLERDGRFFCETDYYRAYNPKCAHCHDTIMGSYVNANGQSYHPDHFVCSHCSTPLKGAQYRLHEQKPVCDGCYESKLAVSCYRCGKHITGQVSVVKDRHYHRECFTCEYDGHQMRNDSFHLHEGAIYCPEHYILKFAKHCKHCTKPIEGEYLQVLDFHFHKDCWKCASCKTSLATTGCSRVGDGFYCTTCATAARDTLAASPPAAAPPSQQQSGANGGARKHVSTADIASYSPPSNFGQLGASSSSLLGDAPPAPAVDPFPESRYYTHEQLLDNARLPASVDRSQKQEYLTDADFTRLLGMDRAAFAKLKDWRQNEIKKKAGLF